MSLKRLMAAAGFGLFMGHSLMAYQSTETFLKEADDVLSMRKLSALIPADRAIEVAKLAQEEDLDIKGPYLISDRNLRYMRRSGLIDCDFGRLMEDFQAECDRLGEDERMAAIAAWRGLWLEKTFAYVRYLNSLKPVWAFDFLETLDYSSNASLTDPDTVSPNFSGDDDVGLGVDGTLKYRPTMNYEKQLGWGYEARLNGFHQMQSSEDSLDVDNFSINNGISFDHPLVGLRKISIDWNYLRSYSQAPSAERMEYGRHSLILGAASTLQALNGYFGAYYHTGSFQYRAKEEFPATGGVEENLDTFVLQYGLTLIRQAENVPFQAYTAGFSYENENADVAGSRNYDAWTLKLNYNRSLSDYISRYAVSVDTGMSFRVKDASGVAGYSDEEQFMATAALRAVWNAHASSSLSLSYLNKNKENASDVDQWRVAWTNVLTTF